ncbi:hypothetical protein L1987_59534 [Smallanthus sonchifolius]|uniref:Uncharacterized protein n=1 Tax=Smallanthus sonchifolius TaxID=185202 RepID=A0ACB9D5S3_9ASTR|nr:hypothetical protein L1987_59534 [Smallanthus sonchifolius]
MLDHHNDVLVLIQFSGHSFLDDAIKKLDTEKNYSLDDAVKKILGTENQGTYWANIFTKSFVYSAPHIKQLQEDKVKHNLAFTILKFMCKETRKSNSVNDEQLYNASLEAVMFDKPEEVSNFVRPAERTARYADEDFHYNLPKRLTLGLVMLFMSTGTMLIAFSATLYIMFWLESSWILIIIGAITCLPIALFVALQLPLLVELISSTYGRGMFRKRRASKGSNI